jgi:serralysin
VHTSFRDYGVSGLNQGIFSTMSYNTGYQTTPSLSYLRGNEAGPMALDIAALQALYGKNKPSHQVITSMTCLKTA